MQGFNWVPLAQRRAFAKWAGGAGTRFAGRVGGFWSTPRSAAQIKAQFDTLRLATTLLHNANPQMVVQGAVFEVVEVYANNLPVPNKARAEFGEDTVAIPRRRFRFASMMYPEYFTADNSQHYRWDDRPPGAAPGIPDMSRTETQLWFYVFARQQIDAGCEAIHFGQVRAMDDHDAGHHGWWSMLQRVRAYARNRNRGFVLCDAHTHEQYYDPDPDHPLPTAQRQLLFDFHSSPLRPIELDTLRHGTHGAYLDYADADNPGGAPFGRSGGGVAPNGQPTPHLPALAELDNGTSATPGVPGQRALAAVWGLDEITWFATQPPVYRNDWLVYAEARVRQLDATMYLEMPGMRNVSIPPGPERIFQADEEGQLAVIPAIWAGREAKRADQLLLIGPVAP